MWRIVLLLIFITPSFPFVSWAQDDPEVEALYDKLDAGEEQASKKRTERRRQRKSKEESPSRLSELAKLDPFSDIAVISLKFLPKTERFEFTGSGMLGLNNAFFNNMGLALRAGYYFKEQHGLELSYFMFSDSQRQITEDLDSKRGIETRALVVPESFMGISYKWAPIYGKMAWLNHKIVHYDVYFLAGVGQSKTAQESGISTISLGAGQTFASSKSFAFRWDFTFNTYTAKVTRTEGGSDVETSQGHSDLFLSFGATYYIPEATYR